LRNPLSGATIDFHMIAVPTVRIAHGTSTTARRTVRPRNAACISSAIPIPITSSSVTEIAVKMNVTLTELQNAPDPSAEV